jgi:hypothetical protein
MTGVKRIVTGFALSAFACALGAGQPAEAQDLQQKLAAAMRSAAQNQQALRSYGIPASQIQVRITNSSYQKLAP